MSNTSHADPLIGTTIAGRYRIVRRVGVGGMGSVYLAEQGALQQEVALKILASDKVGSPQAVERFQKEALFVAGLKHPNIVGVYDLEVAESGDFIMVMEFLRGKDLRDALRDTGPRFPWQRTIPIVEDVCRALSAAHEQGVIHRDLKPENIFLVEGGRPDFAKVLDFGVAKATRADRQLTQTGMLVGTPSYIAPEQIKGRPVASSDLYSLGIMWFEMIAGRKPFVGEGVDLLWMHVDDAPPTLAQVAPDVEVPVLIEEIIAQLLEKNPKHRPESADALMDHLQTLIERSTSGLRLPPPVARRENAAQTFEDDGFRGRENTDAAAGLFTEVSDDRSDVVPRTEVSRRRPAAKRDARGETEEENIGVLTSGDLLSATGRSGKFRPPRAAASAPASDPLAANAPGETFVEGMSLKERSASVRPERAQASNDSVDQFFLDDIPRSNPNHVGPMVDESEPTLAPSVPAHRAPGPNHVGPAVDGHEETYTTNERPSRAMASLIAGSVSESVIPAPRGIAPGASFNSPDDPTRTIGAMGSDIERLLGPHAPPPMESGPLYTDRDLASLVDGDINSVVTSNFGVDEIDALSDVASETVTGSGAMPLAPHVVAAPPKQGSVVLPVVGAIFAGLVVVVGAAGFFLWMTRTNPAPGIVVTPSTAAASVADAGPTLATGSGGRTIADLSGRPAGPGEGEPDAVPEVAEETPDDAEEIAHDDTTRPDRSERRRTRRRSTPTQHSEPAETPPSTPTKEPKETTRPRGTSVTASEPKTSSTKATRIDVSVASRPAATVVVDGKKQSRQTPLAGSNALQLTPGPHDLVLIDADGDSYRYRIVVPKTESPTVKCKVLVNLGGSAVAKGGVSIRAAN